MTRDFLPVSNEICAICIDDDVTKNPNEHTSILNRDFVVYPTKRLPRKEYYQDWLNASDHRHHVLMIFVLFFPFGDKMWGVAIMRDFTVTAKVGENTRTRVTLREYYVYFFFLQKRCVQCNLVWRTACTTISD
jgi:hypothetical protein